MESTPTATRSATAGPDERGTRVVLLTFVMSRLVLLLVTLLSRAIVPPGPLWQRGSLLGALTQGDAGVYVAAARSGDWLGAGRDAGEIGFAPLFPMLISAASIVLRNEAFAGILIANVSLFFAGLLLYRLTFRETGNARLSGLAVTFLMFCPGSFFLSSPVPESTALLLGIAAFYAARMGRWGVASVSAVCLAATLSLGAWIAVPLVIEYVQQARRDHRGLTGLLQPRALLLLGIPLYLAVAVALGFTNGRELVGLAPSAGDWHAEFSRLRRLSASFQSYRVAYDSLFTMTIAAATLLWFAAARLKSMRVSYFAYAAALIAACLWTRDLEAPRVLTIAFPLFVALAAVVQRLPAMYELALTSSTTLLVVCTIAAANGFWLT